MEENLKGEKKKQKGYREGRNLMKRVVERKRGHTRCKMTKRESDCTRPKSRVLYFTTVSKVTRTE